MLVDSSILKHHGVYRIDSRLALLKATKCPRTMTPWSVVSPRTEVHLRPRSQNSLYMARTVRKLLDCCDPLWRSIKSLALQPISNFSRQWLLTQILRLAR